VTTRTPDPEWLNQLSQMSVDDLEELAKSMGWANPQQFDVVTEIVGRQMDQRMRLATAMATDLTHLNENRLRRLAAFTLRCDNGCLLVMILGRARIAHRWSPPNNELLICWTRKGWRAELMRWLIREDPLDKVTALPVACRHGAALFQIGSAAELVSHVGPDSIEPDTLFAFGAARRLSDHLTNLSGRLASWPLPGGRTMGSSTPADWTVGRLTLGDSWRPHGGSALC